MYLKHHIYFYIFVEGIKCNCEAYSTLSNSLRYEYIENTFWLHFFYFLLDFAASLTLIFSFSSKLCYSKTMIINYDRFCTCDVPVCWIVLKRNISTILSEQDLTESDVLENHTKY